MSILLQFACHAKLRQAPSSTPLSPSAQSGSWQSSLYALSAVQCYLILRTRMCYDRNANDESTAPTDCSIKALLRRILGAITEWLQSRGLTVLFRFNRQSKLVAMQNQNLPQFRSGSFNKLNELSDFNDHNEQRQVSLPQSSISSPTYKEGVRYVPNFFFPHHLHSFF